MKPRTHNQWRVNRVSNQWTESGDSGISSMESLTELALWSGHLFPDVLPGQYLSWKIWESPKPTSTSQVSNFDDIFV